LNKAVSNILKIHGLKSYDHIDPNSFGKNNSVVEPVFQAIIGGAT